MLGACLVALIGIAYVPSLAGAFVFDDITTIVENPTLREWWRLDRVLSAASGTGATTDGRPLLNLTFAFNYAVTGLNPWSYHVVNVAIHAGAALAAFGWLRRTLQVPAVRARLGAASTRLSFVMALLWALHPLQTQAVSYVVQRAESLMGLCYLLTMYCFARGVVSLRPANWFVAALVTCFLGMATKEVMVSAPLMVLLYDRTFVAGSWREAWRQRRGVHLALMSTWVLLVFLVLQTDGRGGTAGLGTDVTSWSYVLTQAKAIGIYLGLALWPYPLIFDYGTSLADGLLSVWPQASGVILLVIATTWAVLRRPQLGFVGAWFLLILAPSSSIVPVATQTMSEHRMYLPLLAIVAGGALLTQRCLGRQAAVLLLLGSLAAAALTFDRNRVYRTEISLWSDTVTRHPANARARTNLGIALLECGRIDEAITHYRASLAIDPKVAATHVNLAGALRRSGQAAAAAEHARIALQIEPGYTNAQVNLAHALADLGELETALHHYQEALRAEPDARDVHVSVADVLVKSDRPRDAIPHFESALRLDDTDAALWCDLGRAFAQTGDRRAATRAIERAIQINPNLPDAYYVAGNLAVTANDFRAASAAFHRAVELAPTYLAARTNLANVLLMLGNTDEAIAHYREVLRANPHDASAQENLAQALEVQRTRRR